MLTRPIPSTGETIPVIGLGTWQTFDVGQDAEKRARLGDLLQVFSAAGGKVIDSSPMYGTSEAVVGDLAATLGLHEQLFIATKVWTAGKIVGNWQMEASIRKLRATRIDLMQVHNLVDVETHLETLREWKEQGRVRYIGVTHYTANSHDALARLVTSRPLDFVQVNYSTAEREAERRLLPVALEHGVAVIANRPFASGELVRRLQQRPLPSWAREIDCHTWSQVLLKFVVSHPAITCAIPATSNMVHLRENLCAGEGSLPDATLRERIAKDAN